MKKMFKRVGTAVAGAGAYLGSQVAMAIDMTAVDTAMGEAATNAGSVGTQVIGVVAVAAGIGIIIFLVKKV